MVRSWIFCLSIAICTILVSTTVRGATIGDYWTQRKPAPYPLALSGATVANGVVYVAGGLYVYNLPPNTGISFAAYFPSNDSWKILPSMLTPRQTLGVVAIQDKIYTIGGDIIGGGSNKTEVYDISSNSWSTMNPMPVATSGFAYASVNSTIYVMGGVDSNGNTRAVWAFDTMSNSWSAKAPLPSDLPLTGGVGGAAVSINGKIYVAPNNAHGVTSALVYDASSDKWTDSWNGPTFTNPSGTTLSMDYYALTAVGERVYMIGGLDANSKTGATKYNLAYDTKTRVWTRWADMPTARWGLVAVTVDGLIYAMGGGGSCGIGGQGGSCVANEAYAPSDSNSPAAPVQSATPNPLSWVASIVIAATIVTVFGLLLFRKKQARRSSNPPNERDQGLSTVTKSLRNDP